jgi:hypothetical protein
VSEKPFDIRTPSALLLASLKPLTKLVWIAVRSYQGQGKYCKASLETIGKRVVNQNGNRTDKGRISLAVQELEKAGWIENLGRLKLRCIVPGEVVETTTNTGSGKLLKQQQTTTQKVVETTTNPTDQSCQNNNGKLLKQQQKVVKTTTRTENQLLKPTSKTNSSKKQIDKPLTLVEKYGHELYDHPAVKSYTEKFPHLKHKILQQHREQIALKIGDTSEALEAWSIILDRWASTVGWKPEKIHNLVDAFQQLMQEHERQNQMNDGTTPEDNTARSQPGRRDVQQYAAGDRRTGTPGVQRMESPEKLRSRRPGELSKAEWLRANGFTSEPISGDGETGDYPAQLAAGHQGEQG